MGLFELAQVASFANDADTFVEILTQIHISFCRHEPQHTTLRIGQRELRQSLPRAMYWNQPTGGIENVGLGGRQFKMAIRECCRQLFRIPRYEPLPKT